MSWTQDSCVACGMREKVRGIHLLLECGHSLCQECFDDRKDEEHLTSCLVYRRRLTRAAPEQFRERIIRAFAEVLRLTPHRKA